MYTQNEYRAFLLKHNLTTDDLHRITGLKKDTINRRKSSGKRKINTISEETMRFLRVAVGELDPDFWRKK